VIGNGQGVTGKGLWRLQETGVEVALFPHDLSKEILAQNAAFIRSQKTLGATILAPKNGDELRTWGSHSIRFKSLNPPGTDTYLLSYSGGSYWPQLGPFRSIGQGIWEIDAHFGSTGEYTLQLVTADSLGSALIRYYQKVTEQNRSRREKLRDKIDVSLLGSDYPGIQMNGLPKGLRFEASVRVIVAAKATLIETALTITYEIECSENVPKGIWLGASFQDKTQQLFFNTSEDKPVSLAKGRKSYDRRFTIAKNAPLGEQMLQASLWRGVVGDSSKSKWIDGRPPIAIKVVE
jgi:hypothetical protein